MMVICKYIGILYDIRFKRSPNYKGFEIGEPYHCEKLNNFIKVYTGFEPAGDSQNFRYDEFNKFFYTELELRKFKLEKISKSQNIDVSLLCHKNIKHE